MKAISSNFSNKKTESAPMTDISPIYLETVAKLADVTLKNSRPTVGI